MAVELQDVGLAPLAEMRGELAVVAQGVPIHGRGGVVRAFAIVDPEDRARLAGYRWYLNGHGYALRNLSHVTEGRGHARMHREVMGVVDPKVEVDHINGDKLDNRKANLRLVTHQQQMQNVPARGGSSKYRGVGWDKNRQKWMAFARHNGKFKGLGRFDSEEEAAQAAAAFRAEHMPYANEERSSG